MAFIEEMFSRLNDAAPLNATEKRNALGGPLPVLFREIAKHKFFTKKIKVSKARYRHLELAAKMLYLEFSDEICDTQRAPLDLFVKENKDKKASDFRDVKNRVIDNLDFLSKIFKDKDELLKSAGIVIVYYVLVSQPKKDSFKFKFNRDNLEKFEKMRQRNRKKFINYNSDDNTSINLHLLEFDDLTQSSNKGSAIQRRYEILRRYIDK